MPTSNYYFVLSVYSYKSNVIQKIYNDLLLGKSFMAILQTILQVFVASPGDIVDERKILKDVINEFNVTWGDTHNVRLDLLKWETHSSLGFGEDAQDVINQQVGDEYDIFLGVMWGGFCATFHLPDLLKENPLCLSTRSALPTTQNPSIRNRIDI